MRVRYRKINMESDIWHRAQRISADLGIGVDARSRVAGIRTRTCLGIVRVLKTFLKTHRSTRIVPDARHYDITLVSG